MSAGSTHRSSSRPLFVRRKRAKALRHERLEYCSDADRRSKETEAGNCGFRCNQFLTMRKLPSTEIFPLSPISAGAYSEERSTPDGILSKAQARTPARSSAGATASVNPHCHPRAPTTFATIIGKHVNPRHRPAEADNEAPVARRCVGNSSMIKVCNTPLTP